MLTPKTNMAQPGDAGDRRVHAAGKIDTQNLGHAASHEHEGGNVETYVVGNHRTGHGAVGDVQGLLKPRGAART